MSDLPTPEQIAAICTAAIEEDGLARISDLIRRMLDVDASGIWITESPATRDLTVTPDVAASVSRLT